MKVFECDHCLNPLFFESTECDNCKHSCGYLDSKRVMESFDPTGDRMLSDLKKKEYKFCKNKEHEVCNWLLEIEDKHEYCSACQLNRTIPNLSDKKNFPKWKNLEIAKHRLIYQLQKIGLDLPSKLVNDDGLCFDFIVKKSNPNIMTGHARGVVTILLREADSVLREQIRKQLDEPYRTLIGHLRHEVGHYFWERLIANNENALTAFRSLFGNERISYQDALQTYYRKGTPDNWRDGFISKYATSHPWEDWAETWAHYLHIMDMVETAHFFGLRTRPAKINKKMKAKVTFDPYSKDDFKAIVQVCMPLSFAVNSINRAMGIPDVYPFVITPAVVEKLSFIHSLLWTNR